LRRIIENEYSAKISGEIEVSLSEQTEVCVKIKTNKAFVRKLEMK
jgi:hypothetical protein